MLTRHTAQVVIAAALDPKHSDQALAVVMGNADHVRRAAALDPEIEEAYVGTRTVARQAGMHNETLTEHLTGAEAIGLIERVDRGTAGRVEDGHGVAGTWVVAETRVEPLDLDLDDDAWQTLLIVLNPRRHDRTDDDQQPLLEPWSRTNASTSGWRTTLVLLALHGLVQSRVDVCLVAAHVGVTPRAVRGTLARLAVHGLACKTGKFWSWTPDGLTTLAARMLTQVDHLGETAEKQETVAWMEQRTIALHEIDKQSVAAFRGVLDETAPAEPHIGPVAALRARSRLSSTDFALRRTA